MIKTVKGIQEEVARFARRYGMFPEGCALLAGVSGGSDSMVMLDILLALKNTFSFELQVLHVHHGIRGEEADRDAAFVEAFCRENGLIFHLVRKDVPALAREWKMGLEEAGRAVRRNACQEWVKQQRSLGYHPRAALAHNRNDQAETMLFQLARGSGLSGMAAIRPSSGCMVRPVLCLDKEDILFYAGERHIPFIQDSTNLSDDYTRNRIRRHIIPLLEKDVNRQAVPHIAKTAIMAGEADDYLRRQAREVLLGCRKEKSGVLFPHDFFLTEHILQSYAVLIAFEEMGEGRKDLGHIHVGQVLALYGSQAGRGIALPGGLRAERQREGVWLYRKEDGGESVQPQPEGAPAVRLRVPGRTEAFGRTFLCRTFERTGDESDMPYGGYKKWLDPGKIRESLVLRPRQAGDYFVFSREGGKKSLSRVMKDDHYPPHLRDKVPLLCQGSEVLWIPGGRLGENVKITKETKTILEICCREENL